MIPPAGLQRVDGSKLCQAFPDERRHRLRPVILSGLPALPVAAQEEATFVATRVVVTGSNTANGTGDLTLNRLTRPVACAATGPTNPDAPKP